MQTVTAFLEAHTSYKVIALQFPDNLLGEASKIYFSLSQHFPERKYYILGDTSYGACCVDEIAADHVTADLVIHYGNACLSPPSRVPVFFSFPEEKMDITKLCAGIQDLIGNYTSKTPQLLFMTDVAYAHHLPQIKSAVNDLLAACPTSKITLAFSDIPQFLPRATPLDISSTQMFFNREFPKYFVQPDSSDENTERILIFIGRESSKLLLNLLLKFSGKFPIMLFDPTAPASQLAKQNRTVNKALMKRYFLIQKIKDCNVFGIVAGTLGIQKYLKTIEFLKALITSAGKKFYFFVVGKVTPVKLAGFEPIDIYVMAACHENSLLDSKEFYKPVVTPFEVAMALGDLEWKGEIDFDFASVLGLSQELAQHNISGGDARYSLVDGSVHETTGLNMKKEKQNEEEPEEAAERREMDALGIVKVDQEKKALAQMFEWSPALRLLKERTWQGLDMKLGETEVQKVEKGREGLPIGYSHEPGQDSTDKSD
eukprot:TRINITY_DN15960_c0_g1_i1.p1 TRINITY_DN15960_c0_g1~~TRINITY_DN15960_c0_g1_i1.p1  ORF type:complete len:485 (-),score=89.53 TRINITY_DN15960_c0_g1_i1:715-2169(-)